MSTLYLDRSGSALKLEGGSLVITTPQGRQTLPLMLLERVVIAARTRLDSSLLGRLAEADIAVVLLDVHRSGRRALLLGSGHRDASVRLAQYRLAEDRAWRLAWARSLVTAKIRRQRRWLEKVRQSRREPGTILRAAIGQLALLENRLETAASLPILRGVEGSAGRCFFTAYKNLFPKSLDFDGRQRRPPPDPVNAALSLAYTLLHVRAVQMSWAAGLDPMIGFYHDPAWGRESLACDLIEPWRPCAEAWVYEWFRSRWLDGNHFTRKGAVCRLGKSGRQRFFSAFENQARPVQRALRRQAAALAARLREDLRP